MDEKDKALFMKKPDKHLKKFCPYTFNNLLQFIFSVKNKNLHKIITIFGIKIKLKNKYKKLENKINSLESEIKEYKELVNTMHACFKKGINKEKINYEIENMCEILSGGGKNNEVQKIMEPRLIVSLTSYPDRMYDIHYSIYSLLKQTLKPDKIILWLAEEEFENKKIPQKLLNFQDKGLTIKWYHNIKSYKKLIPALKKYPDYIIATADDDIYYPENWLEILYNEYKQNPDLIHAHRCHKVDLSKNYNDWQHCIEDNSTTYNNFMTGAGGILYPPHSLHSDVLKEELFTSLAPEADDIWFWAMAVLNGTKIKVCNNPVNTLIYTTPKRAYGFYNETTLMSSNCDKNQNDVQLNNIINHYPEIKNIIN